jgi:hypothetical protein
MEKKFNWNMTMVYSMPYTLSLGITPTVTVPNYEVIFLQVEQQLIKLTEYKEAQELCERMKKSPLDPSAI